jgi:xanthine/CO dehydrogenase XdhC/CoxF family maturation factor
MAGSDVRESALDLNKVSKDDNILNEAAAWREHGHKVALATVVKTWGSSPRPAGSQLAVHEDGSFVGSVSGGCIEGAVVTEALEVMKTGKPKVLEYGITDDLAWEVGLACGGQVRVFVEALD